MRVEWLFRTLALLALLLAPAGMLSSHAAMAMPHQAAATAMSHCADEQAPSGKERQAMLDCALACSAMPAVAPLISPDRLTPAPLPVSSPEPLSEGQRPEASTPPPRFS